jgi:ABC-2 type transport system ATP-binding protein
MQARESIIAVRALSRRFGELKAVDGLNLEVAPGEIFGLVGPDGAGKTTTLRLMCGLLDPTEGEVHVDGHSVAREIDAVKDCIGYMAQRFGLYADLTVEENMDFYADLFGVMGAERATLKTELLRMTRMEPFRDRHAGKLSGGMKQKLALMCTLLHHPRILFLDEPTNGVAPVSRRDFWAILYRLVKDGLTVFVTTAYLDEAERCNRVGLMYRGRLIECDTPTRLKSSLPEECYRVTVADRRAARARLENRSGVLSVESCGPDLHLFLRPGETTPARLLDALGTMDARLERIAPSLEDVFIALVRRQEAAGG